VRQFSFFGNHTTLDFVNTVEGRLRESVDSLRSVEDLIAWLVEAGLADAVVADRLRRLCAADAATCERALEEAVSLREALWRAFSAIASGGVPPKESINELNRILTLGPRVVQIEQSPDGDVTRRSTRHADEVTSQVVLLAESAADFLSSLNRVRLRKCARPACSGLFYDSSRAGERRWCDMKTCGNREKATRHYRRHKAGTA
jgi:predicted RNA-binding Zn ribbon-like protein